MTPTLRLLPRTLPRTLPSLNPSYPRAISSTSRPTFTAKAPIADEARMPATSSLLDKRPKSQDEIDKEYWGMRMEMELLNVEDLARWKEMVEGGLGAGSLGGGRIGPWGMGER